MEIENKYVSNQELFPIVIKMLADQKQALFTVTGMSMWPFICHGRDKVVLCCPDLNKLKKGDIVLFEPREGKYILHRIVKITDYGIITAGDGNLFRDGEFPRSCVKGKVIIILRKGRKIDCGKIKWKFVSYMWMNLFPVRYWLLKVLQFISVIKNKFLLFNDKFFKIQ